jgi:single-strand DNA-binding protein
MSVIGNLTADPDLRFSPGGVAVASFTVASTPWPYDRDGDQWRDGEPLFLRCSVSRQPAEHVAESLRRGTRVIASGRFGQRSFHTRDGESRTVLELEVEEIGASLRYATVTISKASRDEGAGGEMTPGDVSAHVPVAIDDRSACRSGYAGRSRLLAGSGPSYWEAIDDSIVGANAAPSGGSRCCRHRPWRASPASWAATAPPTPPPRWIARHPARPGRALPPIHQRELAKDADRFLSGGRLPGPAWAKAARATCTHAPHGRCAVRLQRV